MIDSPSRCSVRWGLKSRPRKVGYADAGIIVERVLGHLNRFDNGPTRLFVGHAEMDVTKPAADPPDLFGGALPISSLMSAN